MNNYNFPPFYASNRFKPPTPKALINETLKEESLENNLQAVAAPAPQGHLDFIQEIAIPERKQPRPDRKPQQNPRPPKIVALRPDAKIQLRVLPGPVPGIRQYEIDPGVYGEGEEDT